MNGLREGLERSFTVTARKDASNWEQSSGEDLPRLPPAEVGSRGWKLEMWQ